MQTRRDEREPRRAWYGRALALLLIAVLGACLGPARGAGGEGEVGESAAALTLPPSAFFITPQVNHHNAQHNQPNAFDLYWILKPGSTGVPNLTVTPSATVTCKSNWYGGSTFGCDDVSSPSSQGYCRCVVSDTSANTAYTYTLTFNGNTYQKTVTTRAPLTSTASFSFGFLSDEHGFKQQENVTQLNRVYQAMAGEGLSFVVSGGDTGTDGREIDPTDPEDTPGTFNEGARWQGYPGQALARTLRQAQPVSDHIPVFRAIGNHDWWGNASGSPKVAEYDAGWPNLLYLQAGSLKMFDFDTRPEYNMYPSDISPVIFTEPGATRRFYSFNWGNSHFLVLDTGFHAHLEVGGAGYGTSLDLGADWDKDQLWFARDDLKAADANPNVKNIFVVMHTPLFSGKGDHQPIYATEALYSENDDGERTYPYLFKIFAKHHVKAVIQGHHHSFSYVRKSGIDFITCSGSADFDGGDAETTKGTLVASSFNHSGWCKFTVAGDSFTWERRKTTNADGTAAPAGTVVYLGTNGTPPIANLSVKPYQNEPGIMKRAEVSFEKRSDQATSYTIQRSVYANGQKPPPENSASWISMVSLLSIGGGSAGTETWVDDNSGSGLIAGMRYWYRVRAEYPSGVSEWSDPVSILIPSCKITGLQAELSGSQVNIAWNGWSTSCPGQTSSAITTWTVARKNCANCEYTTIKQLPDTAPTLTADTTIGCLSNATYRIFAKLDNGHYAQPSDEVSVSLGGIGACAISSTTVTEVTPTVIKIDWGNDNAAGTHTHVERSSDGGATWSTIQQLTPGSRVTRIYDAVTSSCSSSASYLYRVGTSTTLTGTRTYGATLQTKPSRCMSTPRVTATGGAGHVTLHFSVPNPLPGVPAPDAWLVQRRAYDPTGGARQGWTSTSVLPTTQSTYVDSETCGVSFGETYEYRAIAFYSGEVGAAWGELGVASDPSASATATFTHPESGCASDVDGQKLNDVSAWGCPGSVKYADRNDLCAPGYSACSAQQWVQLRDGMVPTHHYWTNDNLQYTGSGSGSCGAVTSGGTVCNSSEARPMRVCTTTSADPEGNTCTWLNCGLGAPTPFAPNAYFGGCSANPTSGTLCCRTKSPCSNGDVVDTVAPGIGGCPGSVSWANRDTLCAPGCRACSVAEWNDFSVVPTHDYWTNDNLRYSGSGSNNCSVSTTTGSSCASGQPMRICKATQPDAEGNSCTWTGCGYGATSPNKYYGGCSGASNATAGTMCCCGY